MVFERSLCGPTQAHWCKQRPQVDHGSSDGKYPRIMVSRSLSQSKSWTTMHHGSLRWLRGQATSILGVVWVVLRWIQALISVFAEPLVRC